MKSIQVIATTFDGTRAAIEMAVLLARASHASFGVLVPKVVPYPLATDPPPDDVDAVVDEYKRLIEELGGVGHVRICLCRSIQEVVDRLTAPGMTLVVGGPSGRWRMSPEERFANRVGRLGRRVLFTSTGPSTTSRRIAWAAALVGVAAVLGGK